MDKGYIYVASCNPLYYGFAVNSCKSLKQVHPKAHVTLFTHKSFINNHSKVFDNIITDIPVHRRAKIWSMARSPYKTTVYMDVDSIVSHPKVKDLHSLIDGYNIGYVGSFPYTVGNPKVSWIDKNKTIPVQIDGSFMVYDDSLLVRKFLQTWYDEYCDQYNSDWLYDFAYEDWKIYDMFTLWRLLHSRNYDVEANSNKFAEFDLIKSIKIPKYYNAAIQVKPEDLKGPRVITQIDSTSYRKNFQCLWIDAVTATEGLLHAAGKFD